MKKIMTFLLMPLFVIAVLTSCSNGGIDPVDKPEEGDAWVPGDEDLPLPIVESVTTTFDNKAVFNQEITVTGQNFSTNTKNNRVLFGDVECKDIIEASETRLVARCPRLTGKSVVLVKVKTPGGTSETEYRLFVDTRRSDSVAVFYDAKVEQLRPGVKWVSTTSALWNGQTRSINVVTIEPSEFKNLNFTFPSGKVKTSEQCEAADALVGINGQYFDNASGGTGLSRDFLKINGVVENEGANNRGDTFVSGAFVFDDTMADIKKVSRNEGARKLTDENVMACGPHLIDNGTYRSLDLSTAHNTDTHPRTAVAITEDGCVLFITVDGRGFFTGMPSADLQEFCKKILGAKSALNLDGGGSTTMYIKGKGVVNNPSDAAGERAVNSIIYLK